MGFQSFWNDELALWGFESLVATTDDFNLFVVTGGVWVHDFCEQFMFDKLNKIA